MKPTATFAVATAPRRDSRLWRQGTVTWRDLTEWTQNPADSKECGNYLLGTLRDGVRSKTTVLSRSCLTLDADTAGDALPETVELVLGYAAIVHTTYSSSPDALRLRIIIPLDRELMPDEYVMAAQVVMQRLGVGQFDPGSSQPERYMFKPAAQRPEWYRSWIIDGDPAPADELLAGFNQDLSDRPVPKPNQSKRDPFSIDGVVGAFNRAYTIDEAIREYALPYQPAGEGRWSLVGARSTAGVNTVAPGLVFSHHVTDPAWNRTCSAFDLVRLHRYGELDEGLSSQTPVNRLPSHTAMLELASMDAKVVAELVGAEFTSEMEGVAEEVSWKLRLKLHKRTGAFLDTIENWDLVREHEPVFQGLQYNELTMAVESGTDLPWRPLSRGGEVFSGVDRAALCHYLERQYHLRPSRSFIDELINTTAHQRYVNPIKDYLLSLEWDGLPRVETCLPGVRPTAYTKMVARKSMVAAVARMLNPGCKWDHSLVLYGSEGLGKSHWVDRMSRGYSATLGRIGDKDTLLAMHRSWIMISDEGHSLKKADADVQKEFLTRTEDVFRLPYDREATAHKRHCVIWGTTNDEIFLRRQEGNRRFLIVKCEDKVDFSAMTDDYIDQVWAEATYLYLKGELLFLDDTETQRSAAEREMFTEEDALAGVLEAFLDSLVPEDWDHMSSEARVQWLQNRAEGLVPEGTERINRTCSTQLWVEALGRRIGDHRRADLLEITSAIKRLPGWKVAPGRHRVPNYGTQVVFDRQDEQ